ncbi:MAG TPA: tetratricopeptide repeat protein [Myxococcales bacterium]|jgi:tetratricopeptide (TPR) repeat protein
MSNSFAQLEVEALVAKVERGEPLSEPELQRLERTCDEHPESLDWLLCLSHALVNSERPARSLSVLARTVERAPAEPLVRLARARALGALERYGEAAHELETVLARSPGHADALRALALLRLKAGAPSDAAKLARQVLLADPLDEATKQILAEAEASTGGAASSASSGSSVPTAAASGEPSAEAFAGDLRRSLAERGLKSRLDPDRAALLVELQPGRVGRLSLPSLHQAALADVRGAAAFTESLVGSLSRLQAPSELPDFSSVRERIFPALRAAEFPKKAGDVLTAPGPAGLLWAFALDHPGFVTFLPSRAAESWGVSTDTLLRLAMENLDRSPIAPTRYRAEEGRLSETDKAWDVLAFDEGDGYDGSRLLSPKHRALLDSLHPGPWIVALPTSGYALLAREGDSASRQLLQTAASTESGRPDGLSPTLFRLAEGLAPA